MHQVLTRVRASGVAQWLQVRTDANIQLCHILNGQIPFRYCAKEFIVFENGLQTRCHQEVALYP